MYNTCFEDWGHRNIREMQRYAEALCDAGTIKERDRIFKDYGVHWSELWRLPYWNPLQMLVIDSMHCILEGLVHYHCLNVLEIDNTKAGKARKFILAFSYPWIEYSVNKAAKLGCPMVADNHYKDITTIHKLLPQPLGDGEPLEDGTIINITVEQLRKRLKSKHVEPLQFVCRTLNLPWMQWSKIKGSFKEVEVKDKGDLADLLVGWVYAIAYIQSVIKTTSIPSWINSVPSNYGEALAGTIKANKWRILSTVYLPIALVTLWGDNNGQPPPNNSWHLQLLDHTMALFQAVTIVCQYTMNLN
ncbi:hypothetical protein EDD18DRAFT_1075890 [Armillaria luteobubalina]|uniref:Uncharacterized protein n=1 Tax=Armillaria luteobubalina TaxID=153913 RepID=A0AA39USE7_9AGAR|nr:hypothetical protein EDD18DRAFT_1075890 [Armillaria luteobubalina]